MKYSISNNYLNNDILLLSEFKLGIEKAYSEIFERFYTNVVFVCNKITKHLHEAQDNAIKSFEKLFRIKDSYIFNNLNDIKFFLFKIARRISLNSLRDRKFHDNVDKKSAINLYTQTDFLNDELDIEYLNALRNLKDNVFNLPIKSIKVLKMIYFENKTYVQIAELLNISPNTVGNLRVQGIKHLKKIMLGFFLFFVLKILI